MTPLAMKVLKKLLVHDRPIARMLASAPTFDMTATNPLVQATSEDLLGTASAVGTDKPLMEHGGLLVPPSEFSWFEAQVSGGRFGALLHEVEDQICFFAYQNFVGRDAHMLTQGFIELAPDEEHFSVHLDARWKQQDAEHREFCTQMGLWLATCLLLINAPHGVERRPGPPHKGLARQIRAAGLGQLKPMHTVRLSLSAGHVGAAGDGHAGSPKAFHFCRSHLRRLPSGETTRVRAHWRGDPAIAVHSPNYKVAA